MFNGERRRTYMARRSETKRTRKIYKEETIGTQDGRKGRRNKEAVKGREETWMKARRKEVINGEEELGK